MSGLALIGGSATAQSSARDSIPLGAAEIDVPSYVVIAADRYLLLSGPSQHLASVDLVSGRVARAAGVGEGPGEYRAIGAVFGCDTTAGWVDHSLRRIVWIAPETGRYVRQLARPPLVAAAGTPVAAKCSDGGLWISMESRTRGSSAGSVTDTVTVFHLATDAEQFTAIATLPSSDRIVARKRSLVASLRLPFTGYAQVIPLDRQRAAFVSRRSDSVVVRSAAGGRVGVAGIAGAGHRLQPLERQAVLDSLEALNEAEMAAIRYDGATVAAGRQLHSQLRAATELPPVLPRVQLAWRLDQVTDRIGVLENGPPGGASSCVAVLSVEGRELGRRCFDWSGRQTHSVLSSSTALLSLQSDGEGEA